MIKVTIYAKFKRQSFGVSVRTLNILRRKAVVGAVSVPLTFFDLVAYPIHVSGPSMEPTLLPGDIIWVKRRFGRPSVGDIFLFTCPYDPAKTYIKRVTALERQIVSNKREEAVNVSDNHLWMCSDNVASPSVLDSRHYGEVNCGLLLGKAVRIIWPPTDGSEFDHSEFTRK